MPRRVIDYIRTAIASDPDGPTDADLLGRFAADRDAAAFELLVWRHAALVLRVCRGVVRDHHTAEDAAQAVFLALARQARFVRGASVASWLFRVARRIAARASRRRGPLLASDINPDTLPAPFPLSEPDAEAERVLHEELARLPERYRVPILLCFFEGMSHTAAATQLGCPVGTVAGRLARAKAMLARQLSRRGVSVAILGATPTVMVPPSFATTTTAAAIAFLLKSGNGISTSILELANREVQVMTVSHALWTAGVVVTCAALTLGVVWAAGPGTDPGSGPVAAVPQGQVAQAPAAAPAKNPSLNFTDSPLVVKPDRTEAVVDRLFTEVSLRDPNDPMGREQNITEMGLFELLDFLSKKYGVTFVIMEEHFKQEGVNDIKEKKPSLAATNLNGLTMHQLLTVVLGSMNASYLIKDQHIEIVTFSHAARVTNLEFTLGGAPQFSPLGEPVVSITVRNKPLHEVAALIAERYNLTVVVTPQCGEARSTPVTSRMLNLPADKALELLAVQYDLRVLRNGNAFVITSRTHAKELYTERMEKERANIELDKLRAPLPKPEPPHLPLPVQGA